MLNRSGRPEPVCRWYSHMWSYEKEGKKKLFGEGIINKSIDRI